MMSLLTLFGGLKNVFKVKTYTTDTVIFRLHYKLTTGLLLACSLLVTAVQLVTDPITCDVKGISGGIFNAYCWTHATFTLPYSASNLESGHAIHPGVVTMEGGQGAEQTVYHGFYQWVGMVLFLQSVTFYVPHFLWKSCEGKRIERLVSGVLSPVTNEDIKTKFKVAIAKYFHDNKRRNALYGLKFVICEFLNLINCSLQIFLIDKLLGGEFTTYGLQVLKFASLDDEERIDPMVRIFPKVTKCSFQNFGVSGSIQVFDGLCVLPINMINDKIYILLWFWLFILVILSGLHFIYRTNYLKTVSPSLSKRTYLFLQQSVGFGDWLVLVMMAIHLDIKLFSEILEEIECVGRSEEQSLGASLSTGVDTEETEVMEKRDRLRRSPSRGCLSSNVDMLTLKIDNWSIDDPSEQKDDGDNEDKDEALEQHLLEMEIEDRENDSD